MDATPDRQLADASVSDLVQQAWQQAGDAVIIIDSDGKIRGWNAHSEQLFGHRAADVLGEDVAVMIPERLRAAHDAGFAKAMTQGHLSSEGRARRTKAVRADGSTVYVEMTFAVVVDANAEAIGSVAVAREWVKPA
ncbi:PAS domain-containing protein [Luteococcus sp. Sow4_B9]|uniref:PAS domain-containing protein n=1 Tax=Luteococcus sp. Sow4_B9 TaxID=3438792 RepID=UPI003F98FE4E